MGLDFSKNKHLKKQLAANFETLSQSAGDCVHHQNLEDFYEFLRTYTDIITKNVYVTRDFNHNSLTLTWVGFLGARFEVEEGGR